MFKSLLESIFPSVMKHPSDPPTVPSPPSQPNQRVTGSTWKVRPMDHPVSAPWKLGVSSTDAAKLLGGYQPAAMEDRWMCRSDGPDPQGNIVVHVYRSWTGDEHLQIKARLSNLDDGTATRNNTVEAARVPPADITEIVWDASSGVSECEAKTLATMICKGVLGCELEMSPEKPL
ncbi:hypothetical protein CDEST_04255 [Colletotrichum destructivum]|uniref:Uncharacterized protein n=1 Tax=Colletotrichum destructivum TaxID=34406 RepID=A0AAX4I838_9PEZI|nr:hypothetical protein CDEST_04255 [Colletotrichum destructivum]